MSDKTRLRAEMLAILGSDAQHYPHFIDKNFPHIMRRIVELWEQPRLDSLLNGLLAPTGAGCVGFPRQALREIVDIRQLLRLRMAASGHPLDAVAPDRNILWTLVDFERENYPVILESQYPHLLQDILGHLGEVGFNARIDALLMPSRQQEFNFQEAALIELMTLKVMHGARYFPKDRPSEKVPSEDVHGDLSEGHAAHVFDRFHRR